MCNMTVLVIACTAQARAMPMAHVDANVAELGLLLCSILLILVGMGTREIRDKTTHVLIDDPTEREQHLAGAESGAYYVVIYTVMVTTIVITLFIILRRVGSLRHQLQMGRQRKLFRDDHLGGEDAQEGALPDEITALIHKSRIDAASAWFNEKVNDRSRRRGNFMRMLHRFRQCGRQRNADNDIAAAAMSKYKVVRTRIFVLQMPSPGQISQLKKRLLRKVGVVRVTIDADNCTVFCWHDLSVCSGSVAEDLNVAAARRRDFLLAEPGGGSLRVRTIGSSSTEIDERRRVAAAELLRVVNSVVRTGSQVYIAAEDVTAEISAWATNLLPLVVGVLLITMHQIAGQSDCSRVTTIPMNCSYWRAFFSAQNSNSSALLPAAIWDPWTGAATPDGRNVTCASSDSNGTFFEVDCGLLGYLTEGCLDVTSAFPARCDFIPYHNGKPEASKIHKHTFSCKELQSERNANQFGTPIMTWIWLTTQGFLCNFRLAPSLLVTILVCSLPLVSAVVGAGLKRRYHRGSIHVDAPSLVPHKQSMVPYMCTLTAVVVSMLEGDYEGAAAAAVLSGLSEHICRHARSKAAKAIDAAVARVAQTPGGVSTIRETYVDEENQTDNDLRDCLRDATDNDDESRHLCSTGPGKSQLNTITNVYTVASIAVAICLWLMPWMLQTGAAAGHLRRIAVVLLVSASPSAVIVCKADPFWCSVAVSARQGCATRGHVEKLLLSFPSSDESNESSTDHSAMYIGRMCRRTTKQNLIISMTGRLATLSLLGVIVSHHGQNPVDGVLTAVIAIVCRSPWYVLLADLLVTSAVVLNSTRCAIHCLVHSSCLSQCIASESLRLKKMTACAFAAASWVGTTSSVASVAATRACSTVDGSKSQVQQAAMRQRDIGHRMRTSGSSSSAFSPVS